MTLTYDGEISNSDFPNHLPPRGCISEAIKGKSFSKFSCLSLEAFII